MIPIIAAALPAILETVGKAIGDPTEAAKAQAEITTKVLETQAATVQAQSQVVSAEASAESWLQRSWRPLVMLWLMALVSAYWFGYVPAKMPESVIEDLFLLVQIGIGGYVTGRSIEKTAKALGPRLKR